MNAWATNTIGRIALHILAMAADHQVRWHMAGIRREFAHQR